MKLYLIILMFFCPAIIIALEDIPYFEKNVGQFHTDVFFKGKSLVCNVWIINNKIRFQYINYEQNTKLNKIGKTEYVYEIQFIDASFEDIIENGIINQTKNYIGKYNCSVKEISQNLIIKNLYQQIDLHLYFDGEFPRYDFHIRDNADPQKIQYKINSDKEVTIYPEKLLIKSSLGLIEHRDLKVISDNSFQQLPQVKFSQINDRISFDVAKSDLENYIIDPIIFSTFLGGEDYDIARDMTIDNLGNVYICGYTQSEEFPTTIGTFQELLTSSSLNFPDIFISKLDTLGTELIFSTYLGGWGDDYAETIMLDDANNIIVGGYTLGLKSFPLTENAYDTTDNGAFDAFLLKLNSEGDSLIYSTLLGGIKDDYIQDISSDINGNIYVTGYTTFDNTFPEVNSIDFSQAEKTVGFVSKFNNDLSQLLNSQIIGGENDDFAQTIGVDGFGNIHIAGITRSDEYPVTQTALIGQYQDSTNDASSSDGFYSVFNSNFNQLVYSTYLGGKSKDAIYDLIFDQQFNTFLSGYSDSQEYPTTQNAYDTTYNNQFEGNGTGDVVITKFDRNFNLEASTFYGGNATDRAFSIDRDQFGNIYVTGSTNSTNLPMTEAALVDSIQGKGEKNDVFVAEFSNQLDILNYSTYLGGISGEVAHSVKVHHNGDIFISGFTSSDDFPSKSGFDTTYNDNAKTDIFVTKLRPSLFIVDLGAAQLDICQGDTVNLGYIPAKSGNYTYEWSPNYAISDTSTPFANIYPDTNTFYRLTITDEFNNSESGEILINVIPLEELSIIGNSNSNINAIETYRVIDTTIDIYRWSVIGGDMISDNGLDSIQIRWTDPLSGLLGLYYENDQQCSDSIAFAVLTSNAYSPIITADSDLSFCDGDSVTLDAGEGFTQYFWNNGVQERFNTIKTNGDYWVIVRDADGLGGISDTVTVNVFENPKPIIVGDTLAQPDTDYEFTTNPLINSTLQWEITNGEFISNNTTSNVIVSFSSIGAANLKVIETSENNCIDSASLNVFVGAFGRPTLSYDGDPDLCEGEQLRLDAGAGYSAYLWNTGAGSQTITVSDSGRYWVEVNDYAGNSYISDTVNVTVSSIPPVPLISFVNSYLRCITKADEYQWFLNGVEIDGANERLWLPQQSGVYTVRITVRECTNISREFPFNISSVLERDNNNIKVIPNPAGNFFEISGINLGEKYKIFNILGVEIAKDYYKGKINISALEPGIYFIELNYLNIILKFVKK